MAVSLTTYKFSVDEYQRMAEAGIFSEDDRVELIEGEIVRMSPIGRRHNACVDRLNALCARLLGQSVIVRVQGSIRLSRSSEPQPDLALLRPRDDFYADVDATPRDTLLILEVADSSVEADRNSKIPMYAKAGISEVWLIDIQGQAIEVYLEPQHGRYKTRQRLGRGDAITASSVPALAVEVEAILGPPVG